MKKLINYILPSLLLFCILLVSCDKEPVKKGPLVINDLAVSYHHLPLGGPKVEGKDTTGKVTIKGDRGDYYFTIEELPCCKGIISVESNPKWINTFVQEGNKGVGKITVKDKGKWWIYLKVTCPDGTVHQTEIIITIE